VAPDGVSRYFPATFPLLSRAAVATTLCTTAFVRPEIAFWSWASSWGRKVAHNRIWWVWRRSGTFWHSLSGNALALSANSTAPTGFFVVPCEFVLPSTRCGGVDRFATDRHRSTTGLDASRLGAMICMWNRAHEKRRSAVGGRVKLVSSKQPPSDAFFVSIPPAFCVANTHQSERDPDGLGEPCGVCDRTSCCYHKGFAQKQRTEPHGETVVRG